MKPLVGMPVIYTLVSGSEHVGFITRVTRRAQPAPQRVIMRGTHAITVTVPVERDATESNYQVHLVIHTHTAQGVGETIYSAAAVPFDDGAAPADNTWRWSPLARIWE